MRVTTDVPSLRLDDRVALVTGAGGGLGRAHAWELARRGARVAVNDIGVSSDGAPVAQFVVDELQAAGHRAVALQGDVGVEEQATALVEQTVAELGRIDVLVNNAGNGAPSTAQETSTALMREILEVHVFGMFWTQRAALAHMRRQDYGRIINTSSAVGVFGGIGTFAYSTAKAAVLGMTRAASLDNTDRDIRINALAPVARSGLAAAYFDSNARIDTTRLDPSYCSPVVAYLAHDSCELDGQLIAVGGGRAARVVLGATPGLIDADLDAEKVSMRLDEVLSTDGLRLLDSSLEQYDLLPTFDQDPKENLA